MRSWDTIKPAKAASNPHFTPGDEWPWEQAYYALEEAMATSN
jgi:hypothetical protein